MKDLVKQAQARRRRGGVIFQDEIPPDTLRGIADELDLPHSTVMTRYYRGARGFDLIKPLEPNLTVMARLMGIPYATCKKRRRAGRPLREVLHPGRLQGD